MNRLHTAIQFALCVGLASAHSQSWAAGRTAPHKVEFVSKDEFECLQPVVNSADATEQDFNDAMRRWLRTYCPGRRGPGTEIMLRPPTSDSALATIERETVHMQWADGSEHPVCFDFYKAEDMRSGRE